MSWEVITGLLLSGFLVGLVVMYMLTERPIDLWHEDTKKRLMEGYYGERLKAEYERKTKMVDVEPWGRQVQLEPPKVIGTIDVTPDEHWEHLHPKKK